MRLTLAKRAWERVNNAAAREGISREEVIKRAIGLYLTASERTSDGRTVLAFYNEEENSVSTIAFNGNEDDGDVGGSPTNGSVN